MKIVRYREKSGALHFGRQHPSGSITRATGNVFESLTDTGEPAEVDKILTPIDPPDIICIGLNYQAHVAASQSADKAPANPLVFLKPPSSIKVNR